MAWLSPGGKSGVHRGLVVLLKPSLLLLLGARVDLVKRPKDDAWCEHLGQSDGWLPWEVKDIGWYSTAAEFRQRRSNRFIMFSPVGPDQHDPGVMQAAPHVGSIEDCAFIDLAAQAPASSEVHKDGTPLGAILLEGCTAVRLPAGLAGPGAGAGGGGV